MKYLAVLVLILGLGCAADAPNVVEAKKIRILELSCKTVGGTVVRNELKYNNLLGKTVATVECSLKLGEPEISESSNIQ